MGFAQGVPPKTKHIFTIDSPNGGFSIGTVKIHLEQTHEFFFWGLGYLFDQVQKEFSERNDGLQYLATTNKMLGM